MSTLKSLSISVDIEHDFHVDIKMPTLTTPPEESLENIYTALMYVS